MALASLGSEEVLGVASYQTYHRPCGNRDRITKTSLWLWGLVEAAVWSHLTFWVEKAEIVYLF